MSWRWTFLLGIAILSCEPEKSKKPRIERTEDGVVKSYTKDGKLEAEITYKDGKRNGIARNYFRNGKVNLEINYQNGKKHGIASRFYESGNLFQTTEYKDDEMQGLQRKYKEDGSPISEARYEGGEPCLGLKEYLVTGEVKKKYPSLKITPIDRLADQGVYILAITLTDRNNSVKYYKGKLTPTGCLSNRVVPIEYNKSEKRGELKYHLPPGGFLMEEVSIIAVVKTALGNEFVLQRTYPLAIDN